MIELFINDLVDYDGAQLLFIQRIELRCGHLEPTPIGHGDLDFSARYDTDPSVNITFH